MTLCRRLYLEKMILHERKKATFAENNIMSAIDQKRIAKNTMLLYLRIGVVMLVGLYTSRVVFDALGEVDFGVYNAVGAIVVDFF